MTRHDPISILRTLAAGRTRTGLAFGLTALALLGAATVAGPAAAQATEPTVRVGGGTVTPDGTATVGVVITNAPDGLSGYYLDVSVSTPETARIEAASYPDSFGLTTDPAIRADGATVTLEAADVEGAIEAGASNVTLATVTIHGVTPGEAELAVEPRQFDADDGSGFRPGTRAGAVTVTGDDATGTSAAGTGAVTVDSAAAAAADATATRTGGSTGGDATPTTGPLPAVLTFVALGALTVVALRRRP